MFVAVLITLAIIYAGAQLAYIAMWKIDSHM